jgi:hypothetical protein
MRYVETLKDISSGGPQSKLVYLPYEATGLLGALGGIKDLFQHTDGTLPVPRPAPAPAPKAPPLPGT